jgi:hypothetical protein
MSETTAPTAPCSGATTHSHMQKTAHELDPVFRHHPTHSPTHNGLFSDTNELARPSLTPPGRTSPKQELSPAPKTPQTTCHPALRVRRTATADATFSPTVRRSKYFHREQANRPRRYSRDPRNQRISFCTCTRPVSHGVRFVIPFLASP